MKQMIHMPSRTSRPSPVTSMAAGTRARVCANGFHVLRIGIACLLASAGLLFTGCGGKDSNVATVKPEDVKPVDANASADAQQNQRMKMMVAMRDGVMPPEPALKLRGGEQATPEVLAAYNQLLLRAMVQRREPPESLQELARWPLPRVPTPPAGKRIVYDTALCIVRLDPP